MVTITMRYISKSCQTGGRPMAKRKNREVVVRKNYTADSKRKVNKVVKANRKYKDTFSEYCFLTEKICYLCTMR